MLDLSSTSTRLFHIEARSGMAFLPLVKIVKTTVWVFVNNVLVKNNFEAGWEPLGLEFQIPSDPFDVISSNYL